MNKTWTKWFLTLLSEAGYEEGGNMVVGVSGGPDSLALLHRLRVILDPAVLFAAHLDHGIRPSSSAEAKFVADLVRSWVVPFFTKRVNVPELAKRHGWSLEEAARNARYEFLAETAQEVGTSIVAIGHHADDQAETILMHFLRGSGLRGLRGMLPLSPFPGVPDLSLLRPLINQSKDEIEAYCQQHNLHPIMDESNSDPAYFRNRIRLQLLPELKTYNPQIKDRLLQLAAVAVAEDDLVSQLFEDTWPDLVLEIGSGWLSLDRSYFRDLPVALQRRAIRRAVELLHPEVSDLAFKTVEQALELVNRQESGIETMLPGGLTLLSGYETLLFARDLNELPVDLPQMPAQLLTNEVVQLPVPGKVVLANGWVLSAELIEIERDLGKHYPQVDPWTAVIDLPHAAALYVRPRKLGERMQPLGMRGHSSSLQNIMVNRKIAARLRQKWPLIATNDHVVWLTGHIIDHRARITENPRRIVRLVCARRGGKS